MDTDGCCGHDAGIHVDEMYVKEESTKGSLRQAEEGIIGPKGEEEDKGRIGYHQVEHVDVGVRPGGSLCNEGPQSCRVDNETHDKQRTVGQTQTDFHCAVGIGDVVAHTYL